MNNRPFQDIVRGKFGRKIAYTNVEKITDENILSVVSKGMSIHNMNKIAVRYLWDYKNGDQPVLYRNKTIRDDIVNHVVENHAWEIVAFKVAQTYGEPIQFVSIGKDEKKKERIDEFNNYERAAGKGVKSIMCGEWQSTVGMGYQAVGFNEEGADVPYKILTPTPMNTFVIYSRSTGEPMLAVQELKDENDKQYTLCYSKTHEYRITKNVLTNVNATSADFTSKLHGFGGIPIVEYPNNQDRLSDIELIITMLDSINEMQSNRQDSIGQFVQSWIKFVNCEIDPGKFQEMKMNGALVVTTNNDGGNKADVDIMSQELNQTQTQVAKDDLWDSALTISAIPNKQGSTGGDSQGAVELRNGWDFSKSRAKLKDPFVVESEKQLAKIKLNVMRVRGKNLGLTAMDYEPQITHSPTDNLFVKAESLEVLLRSGVSPEVAICTCGLWNDPEKAYLQSKPYMDVIYKTIEDTIKEQGRQEELDNARAMLQSNEQKATQSEVNNVAVKGNNGFSNEKR